MIRVLACVDSSAYAPAVCEFAALFADRMDAEVQLISVEEAPQPEGGAEAALRLAVARLSEHGFERFSASVASGPFVDAISELAAGAELIVMGKRGVDRAGSLGGLGRHVEPVLRQLQQPTCLVSQLFLPISHALVVLDSDPAHRRAMEFATTSPTLSHLQLELLLMDDGRHLAEEKLTAARTRLEGRQGAAYTTLADNPDQAVGGFVGGADLLVMSREMLFGAAGTKLLPSDDESFWRRRAPILVC